jgi:hypothetical protein
MKLNIHRSTNLLGALLAPIALLLLLTPTAATAAENAGSRRVAFDGVKSEHKWALKELKPELPADWSDYNFLVLEIKTSTPQRFSFWVYTTNGPRRIMLQPFGQNVWLRASVPLLYFKGRDQSGFDLASTNNRRTPSFWMSVWGPFGDLKSVEALGVTMDYPIGKPTLKIRSIQLTKDDPGSDFIEGKPVLDEFGQWAHADWPRKIKSREQLEKELADEEKALMPGDFNYCEYGGYKNTQAKVTQMVVRGSARALVPVAKLEWPRQSRRRRTQGSSRAEHEQRSGGQSDGAPSRSLGAQHRRRWTGQALHDLPEFTARIEHVPRIAGRLLGRIRPRP